MNWPMLVAGIAVATLASVDALWTTLWVDSGAGPVTRRVDRAVRRIARGAGRRTGREPPRRRGMTLAGPAVVAGTLATWIALVWAGWSMMFASAPGNLVSTTTGSPADLSGTVYFVGYTLFTLGNGDFSPVGSGWQLATATAAGSGLVLITLGITYVITVLSAVVEKRTLASQVLGLARDPDALAAHFAEAGLPGGADAVLAGLAGQINRVTEQHLAYPVLHSYHSSAAQKSTPLALATLDEALTILAHGLAPADRPSSVSLKATRAAIKTYLDTLESAHIGPAEAPPPMPRRDAIRGTGRRLADEEEFRKDLEGLADRRRRLGGLVESDARPWSDVGG